MTGVVLAGGASRRMGQDKALIRVYGETLLEKTVAAVNEAGLPALVVGRAFAELPASLQLRPHEITAVLDLRPEQGPLGGLVTGLHYCQDQDAVVLLPCDLPRLRSLDIRWLLEQAQRHFADSTVPAHEQTQAVVVVHPEKPDRMEPLFSVYRTSLLPHARRRMEAGALSMHQLIRSVRCAFIPLNQDHGAAVADVDTPEDLKEVHDRPPDGQS